MKFGFWSLRNFLCAANLLHLVVGVSLMVVAGYGKSYGVVWSLRIISVMMVVGVFLIFISMLGIAGALRQNQFILFTVSFTRYPKYPKYPQYLKYPEYPNTTYVSL
ncbi:tetraspanin-31 [Silurus asotus]|uniref:Tetraspanin-31 n=1 Tax=Silurus asotus TaxID=30991 RepID=A0AAD5B4R2_SILAS|nr:tetraspanin-31 [Silurus asotus]